MTSIDDLPTIEGAGRLGRAHDADSAVAAAYPINGPRSSTLLDSLGISRALELAGALSQQLMPRMFDDPGGTPSYTMYLDCGGYNYGATCDEACFGFAPHHMDPFYCATCPEQAADPARNPSYNWHFVGSRGSIEYRDREPDVCNGRDAWKWTINGQCGNCTTSSTFRCHDGYKKYPENSYWDPTICQGIVACDGRLTPC